MSVSPTFISEMPSDLLIGSANPGKIAELRNGLSGLPLRLRTLEEFDNIPEPEEVGTSYEENALLKARYYRSQTGLLTLADDSGLEVDELNGEPGVLTARFGGPGLTDKDRLVYLLDRLADATNRRAQFTCIIVLDGPAFISTVRGECVGTIARKPLGHGGFGYDPVFVPDGYEQTFAQLPTSIKSLISHRGKAIAAARKQLEALLL